MSKIDDLIEVKKAISVNEDLEKKIKRYYEIESEIDSIRKEKLDDLYDKIDNFEYVESSYDYLQDEVIELEESIEKLEEELKGLGGIEFLQNQYEQQDAELDEMLESIGIGSKYEFDFEKRKYLEGLVSTEYISEIGEKPDTFFRKLIELYGEKELADFSYTYGGEEDFPSEYEEDFPSEYEEHDNYQSDAEESYYTYHISDFVSGDEDEIIGVVSNPTLREVLLASKLKFIDGNDRGDVTQYIQEYVEGAIKKGHNDMAFLDEYGGIDIEETLANFSNLPISKDKNFYLYLAKHLDEMNLSSETLLKYIDPDMVDENFTMTYNNVVNSRKYEYTDEFSYSHKITSSKDLVEWLEGKDKELSILEKEEKTISEAEALIEQQKDGQDIGGK